MAYGYVFFLITKDGSFGQKIVMDQEEPDNLNKNDEVLAKIPLTEKSLLALRAIDAIGEIEKINGSAKSPTSFAGLMSHLIEQSSKASFYLGRKFGQEEQASLQEEINTLTSARP